jgi:site-specific DNA-methyltransferase (adenine-specific)
MVELFNEDCMETMARYPDGYFDLALCDPPFGIGKCWQKNRYPKRCSNCFPETSYKNNAVPPKEYFDELRRVSVEQVIFGYNYFVEFLGPTNHLIIWDKHSAISGFYSQAEVAYTSIHRPVQIIRVPWYGVQMGKETGKKKIHPHQKPVELYSQILRNYANPGWKILDTHMGSASSVVACHRLGLDITASEIDGHYFKAAKKRIGLELAQRELFTKK